MSNIGLSTTADVACGPHLVTDEGVTRVALVRHVGAVLGMEARGARVVVEHTVRVGPRHVLRGGPGVDLVLLVDSQAAAVEGELCLGHQAGGALHGLLPGLGEDQFSVSRFGIQ